MRSLRATAARVRCTRGPGKRRSQPAPPTRRSGVSRSSGFAPEELDERTPKNSSVLLESRSQDALGGVRSLRDTTLSCRTSHHVAGDDG